MPHHSRRTSLLHGPPRQPRRGPDDRPDGSAGPRSARANAEGEARPGVGAHAGTGPGEPAGPGAIAFRAIRPGTFNNPLPPPRSNFQLSARGFVGIAFF